MSLFDIEKKQAELDKLENETKKEEFWQQDSASTSKILAKIKSNIDVDIIEITSDKILFNKVVFNIKNTIIGHIIIFINMEYDVGIIKFMRFASVPYDKTYINFFLFVISIFKTVVKNNIPTKASK